MIYATLFGGLGNMLFEVAGVESFCHDHGLEACFYNIDAHLDHLNRETDCNPGLKHAREYLGMFKNFDFRKNLDRATPGEPQMMMGRTDFSMEDGGTYYAYFQALKFFAHNRPFILDLFLPSDAIVQELDANYPLDFERTASIHVRRGDYVRKQAHHPLIGMEFYGPAIGLVDAGVDSYIVFSDDLPWCQSVFGGPKFRFVTEKDYKALFLMSRCKYNIIGNSTFSWWGAWLNRHPDKRVIAPKLWLTPRPEPPEVDPEGLIPPEWQRL